MTYETLLTTLDDGVLTLTLNRPEKLNAYNPPMQRDLLAAFAEINARDEIRAVVVTGAGRAFCAGADISGGGDSFKVWGGEGAKRAPQTSISMMILGSLKPVIAAINGAAVGVGATMCLPMDVRLMSSAAKIGFLFNRRGMVMEAGSSWFLPRLVGMQQAQEWVATAELISAGEALAGRLVRSVHAPDELLPAAQALARKMARPDASAVAAALNRRLMWRMAGAADPADALDLDLRLIAHMAQTADAREGVASFLEKRPPTFPLKPSKDMPAWFEDAK
jgi:enoyl-CoA hydratase/carnithine racemase